MTRAPLPMVWTTQVQASWLGGVMNVGAGQFVTRCRHADCDRWASTDLTSDLAAQARSAHESAHGRTSPSENPDISTDEADIEPSKEDIPPTRGRLLTTAQLAGALNVTPRHVRRLATLHGISPRSTGRWAQSDADTLLGIRGMQQTQTPDTIGAA